MEEERLTWEEIKKRYPSQWVSLTQVEKDAQDNIRAGIVVASGPDLKTVTKELKKKHLLSDRFEYTGEIKRFLGFAKWDIEDMENAPPVA